MNKRFSNFFLAAIMAFAMLLPMFAQTTHAQTSNQSVRSQILLNQFNRRALNLQTMITSAVSTVGQDRLMFLLAADIGVPVGAIRAAINNNGTTPLNQLVLGLFLSNASNVPLDQIMGLFAADNSFGQIVIQINADTKMLTINLTGFQNAILDEINSNGNVMATNAASIDNLERAITLMQSRFVTLDAVLGHILLSQIVLATLSGETGFTVDQLTTQFRSGNFSLNSFVLNIMLENIMTATAGLTVDRRLIIGPDIIIDSFNRVNLPTSIFLTRLDQFSRSLTNGVAKSGPGRHGNSTSGTGGDMGNIGNGGGVPVLN